jgi:hypothetical protein
VYDLPHGVSLWIVCVHPTRNSTSIHMLGRVTRARMCVCGGGWYNDNNDLDGDGDGDADVCAVPQDRCSIALNGARCQKSSALGITARL